MNEKYLYNYLGNLSINKKSVGHNVNLQPQNKIGRYVIT